ncbi:MAG: MFS transporter [Phyllobacteriaceae bacterium]|nr:MFS transporter [Phyllobacteriaceae bacterium]
MPRSSTPLRISAFFAASFIPFGVQIPFYPVLLSARGQDAAAIAVITTVPIVLRLTMASWLGSFADRLGDRRRAIVLYAGVALLACVALGPARDFWSLLVVTAAMAAAWNGILPVTDALATGAVRRGEAVYGRMRVWGSAAFVVGNLLAGRVVALWGEYGIWGFMTLGFAAQFVVAFALPRDRPEAVGRRREGMLAGMRAVAADRRLMAVLIGAGVMQASHAMLYGFSSLYWASLGFSGDEIGILWAMGVSGEIALFTFSGHVLPRLGARGLVMLGGIGGVIRWSLFPLLGYDLLVWAGLQLLHATTFAAAHLGTMAVIGRSVDDRRAATAQGMMVSLNGLAMALATIASGPLYTRYGGGGFAAMAVLAAVGGTILTIATSIHPQSAGVGGKTVEPS